MYKRLFLNLFLTFFSITAFAANSPFIWQGSSALNLADSILETPIVYTPGSTAYYADPVPNTVADALDRLSVARRGIEANNYYVLQGGYSTVQDAVNAAELNPNSQLSHGNVTVRIPGGFFDETVVIHKNVSLIGAGSISTELTGLEIRPYSATIEPRNILVRGLTVNNGVVITNETANGSGIYSTNMGTSQIQLEDNNFLSTLAATNINFLSMQGMYIGGTSTFTNTVGVFANFSAFGNVTFLVNSALSNKPSSFNSIQSLGFIMRDGYANNITMNGVSGTTKKATIQAANALISSITYSTVDTVRALYGCVIGSQTLTATPTTTANTMLSIYTPASSGNWSSVPVTLEAGLDTLAANTTKITDTANAKILTDKHVRSDFTTAPTATVNANAGTGATCTVSNASDVAGRINLTTTATAPSAGAQCAVNFNKSYAVAPICVFSPYEANSATLQVSSGVYTTTSTTALTVNFANLDAVGHAYVFSYHCIETK